MSCIQVVARRQTRPRGTRDMSRWRSEAKPPDFIIPGAGRFRRSARRIEIRGSSEVSLQDIRKLLALLPERTLRGPAETGGYGRRGDLHHRLISGVPPGRAASQAALKRMTGSKETRSKSGRQNQDAIKGMRRQADPDADADSLVLKRPDLQLCDLRMQCAGVYSFNLERTNLHCRDCESQKPTSTGTRESWR